MKSIYDKRKIYYILASVSLIMGALFFVTNHFDFIITAMKNDRMNISNWGYVLLRIVSCLLLPAVMMIPSLFEYGRIRAIKLCYILWGAFYILTVFWVIPYLMSGDAYASAAEFQKKQFCVASVVFWDSYHVIASIFSVVFGGFLIYTGISFDDNRETVRRNIIIVFALRIILPIIYNLISNGAVLSSFWLVNNYADILSLVFLSAAVIYASLNDESWIEFIWDQPANAIMRPDEDEEGENLEFQYDGREDF